MVLEELSDTPKKIRINKFKTLYGPADSNEISKVENIFSDFQLRKQYPILCRVRRPVVTPEVTLVKKAVVIKKEVLDFVLIKHLNTILSKLPATPRQIRVDKFKSLWGGEANLKEVLSMLSDVKLRKEHRLFCRVRMK